LEAVALIVQIHLSQNHTAAAQKEVLSAKKWAQDSLLINLAESWVGLRLGGEKYQQAFYEFEEMDLHQGVAEIHMGRLAEAEASLKKASEAEGGQGGRGVEEEVLANMVVLDVLSGKDAGESMEGLRKKAPQHPLIVDLAEKGGLFDQAAMKWSAKIAA
jgi:coatomer protein complex subunit epsilon